MMKKKHQHVIDTLDKKANKFQVLYTNTAYEVKMHQEIVTSFKENNRELTRLNEEMRVNNNKE